MSKASNHSLLLLSCISGAMYIALGLGPRINKMHFHFMEPLLLESKRKCDLVIQVWDETGDKSKNMKKLLGWIAKWDEELLGINPRLTPVVLSSIAMLCWIDLDAKIKNPIKKELLGSIYSPLENLGDFLDKKGEYMDDYEYAETLVAVLYNICGFTP